jgi:hypothetical protein
MTSMSSRDTFAVGMDDLNQIGDRASDGFPIASVELRTEIEILIERLGVVVFARRGESPFSRHGFYAEALSMVRIEFAPGDNTI